MAKLVFAEVLAELGPFKWYSTGEMGEQRQLRYGGRCPKCDIKTHPYWRQRLGGWKCPRCWETLSTRELPGILTVLEKIFPALLSL